MKNFFSIPLIAALVVWVACLAVGFELSQRRPLWNDEIFTQVQSIEPKSYQNLLRGQIPEGNNCPLFYVLQKSVCDVLHYQYSGSWKGEWFVYEHRSQVVLRTLSNVLMSTAIALIFYFFARFYTLGAGLFALAAVLAAPMVWMYWLESRPYALWFFLTTVQSLLFLRVLDGRKQSSRGWLWLALVHVSLALTTSLGAAQVVIASILFWVFKDRRWWHYIFLTVIPLLITIFYYSHTLKFKYWFREGPVQLFLQSVPVEYWMILMVYVVVMVFAMFVRVNQKAEKENDFKISYALYAVLTFIVAWMLLGFLKWEARWVTIGFAISSRYFIFLIPVAVIALTLCVLDLWRVFKNNLWMRINVLIVVFGFLAFRAFKTYIAVLASGIFMHVIR